MGTRPHYRSGGGAGVTDDLTAVASSAGVLVDDQPDYSITCRQACEAAVVAVLLLACIILTGLIEGGY